MDYHQFQTLYPDTLACYRFLENLKWEKGFHCRKCKNEKYFDGSQKFSRRCTRCGYNESITAYTIFHSIKFPIERAFYIAYLTVAGKKDYTLDALAGQLDLRMNTVWSFKHKVTERIHELSSSGNHPDASKWDEVVLVKEPAAEVQPKKRSSEYSECQWLSIFSNSPVALFFFRYLFPSISSKGLSNRLKSMFFF